MKSQKWSKSEALESIYTFKDKLAEYYTACPNKCILKSFKFLASNLDIHFTLTYCILMICYFLLYIWRSIKVQHIHLVIGIHALTWSSKLSGRVLHIKYRFMFSLRFWQQTLLLWQKIFYWVFQIKSVCKIIFGSVSHNIWV